VGLWTPCYRGPTKVTAFVAARQDVVGRSGRAGSCEERTAL
jgi:hypothetical protein